MCGIAGFVPRERAVFTRATVERALTRMAHRGPDDLGILALTDRRVSKSREWNDAESDLILLHRRLSIIDLSELGWQPMSTADGRFHIVYNGEIYNYIELRRELENEGCVFASHSDTEVLLQGFVQWGRTMLQKLVGMFAFAILDSRERTLFLARDFFGIKPLYYVHAREGFAFSSEIKTLLDLNWVSREVNPERLFLYGRFGFTDHGDSTLLRNIKQLPAAHFLELTLSPLCLSDPRRYWSVGNETRTDLSFESAAGILREIFLENVELHLRSDVPLGAALSGGIDSSAIVMAMRHIQGDRLDIHTFSYVDENHALNEERWVDIVTSASGATAHKIRPAPDELVADLDDLVDAQDEPFNSTSIYAQYRVFRAARDAGIKVMLDGQGADEILGGYRYYLAGRLGALLRSNDLRGAWRFLRDASSLPGDSMASLIMRTADLLAPEGARSLLRSAVGRDFTPAWLNVEWFRERGVTLSMPRIHGNGNLFFSQLRQSLEETSLPHLLRYEDRNSMAHSIESRVPFLTPKLVNFLYSLPSEYLVSDKGVSKSVFRAAMKGIVPDSILDRRDKIGFATPESTWLRALSPWVQGVLEESAWIEPLRRNEVMTEWLDIVKGRRTFDSRVWRWVNLLRWADRLDVQFN